MNKTKKTRCSQQATNGSIKQLAMLPEPDFNPKVPPKNTLEYRALSLMLAGKMVTHRNFDKQTDSWRLAAYIHKLRKYYGWPVEDAEVLHIASKKPLARHIKKYYLSEDVINKAKKWGVFYE